jgi:hypothetical protein
MRISFSLLSNVLFFYVIIIRLHIGEHGTVKPGIKQHFVRPATHVTLTSPRSLGLSMDRTM